MSTILSKIIKSKKEWLHYKRRMFPLEIFKNEVGISDRNFYKSLKSSNTVFILECKKASPSKGIINKKFNLNKISNVYKNYANAVSVLTDEKYFYGNFANLEIVKNKVTQPVLCKDFFISEYQVYLARYYNADAILLMLSVLNDKEYIKLSKLAHKLNMDVLTEVSNENELDRAINLKANIIGINNRNFNDLSINLVNTRKLAPKIPKDTIIISESGIYSNQQVRELRNYVNGFLIGSSLMSKKNLELAVKNIIYGKNKVCGLTSIDNAKKAYNAGATVGGFIFVEKSPRFIDIDNAKKIAKSIRLDYVGVFADEDIQKVAEYSKELRLEAIQLHGEETEEYINSLKALIHPKCQIWKAYGVNETMPELLSNADYHLLDTKINNKKGGTGKTFDWSILNGKNKKNIILAGGLNSDNIEQAIKQSCYALDINSGAEYKPGEKDFKKLKEIFSKISNY